MKKTFKIAVPITQPTGKARIKSKSDENSFARIHPTRTYKIDENCYLEWQFKYDTKVGNEEYPSNLPDLVFIGSNGYQKNLYEFSEMIYRFYEWGYISKLDLEDVKTYLLNNHNLIEDVIKMTVQPAPDIMVDGMVFKQTTVVFPQIRKQLTEDWYVDISYKDKQRAVGWQVMLYLCCPLAKLNKELIGRTANVNETVELCFGEEHKEMVLELIKLLGILSEGHKKDMISIIDLIIK